MIDILLNALVPIFGVMGLGYFAGWIRDVDNRHVSELNALVMDFALPASLFVAMATTPSAVLLSQWPLFVTFLVSYLLLYAVSYAMQRRLFRLPPGDAAIQALTIAFPNSRRVYFLDMSWYRLIIGLTSQMGSHHRRPHVG